MHNAFTNEEYLALINEALDGFVPLCGDERDLVAKAMRYSLKNGGKRVRPVLLLEFTRVCGGDVNAALPLACALEMIHTYSLIHDDLPCMDDDDFRRGQPSCHKQFGEATALLAGDGLLTLAFSVASKALLAPERLLPCLTTLADAAGYLGMIGGQTMDLQHEEQTISAELLRATDRLKTGQLICAACRIGCLAAGAGQEKIDAAQCYAENIGLAFQIVDDLLDITGSAEELGKPIGSDEEKNKSTYPALLGLDESRRLVGELTEQALNALRCFDDAAFLASFAEKLAKRTN